MARNTRRTEWDDKTRLKIKTTLLIGRLQDHALGKIELSQTQVRGIEILLRKVVPDLSAVDASVTTDHVNYVINAEPMTQDEWDAKHGLAATERAAKATN